MKDSSLTRRRKVEEEEKERRRKLEEEELARRKMNDEEIRKHRMEGETHKHTDEFRQRYDDNRMRCPMIVMCTGLCQRSGLKNDKE